MANKTTEKEEKEKKERMELLKLFGLAAVLLAAASALIIPVVNYQNLHAPAAGFRIHRVPGQARVLVVEHPPSRGGWIGGNRVLLVDATRGKVLARASLDHRHFLDDNQARDASLDYYDCIPAGTTGFVWCNERRLNVEMALRRLDRLDVVAGAKAIDAALPSGLAAVTSRDMAWSPDASRPSVDLADGALRPIGRDGNVYRIAPAAGPLSARVDDRLVKRPARFDDGGVTTSEVVIGEHKLSFGAGGMTLLGSTQRQALLVRKSIRPEDTVATYYRAARSELPQASTKTFLKPSFLADPDSGQPLFAAAPASAFLVNHEPGRGGDENTIVDRVDETGASLWSKSFPPYDNYRFCGGVLVDDELLLLFRDHLVALDVKTGEERYRVNM
jgi:hypothetical protein